MLLLDPYRQATIAACAGLLTQQVLSPIPEVSTTKSILFYTIANGLLSLALKGAGIRALLPFLAHISLINASYLTSLIFFTIVHRLYFHPLRKFPGNKFARLSKLYEAWINYNGGNSPMVRDLCRKHGDFIRTGPNELAINNVEAVEIIWGRSQPTARGPYYEFANFVGERHLVSQRNKAVHASMRRIWDKGFTSQTVASYSPRVEYHVDRMISTLEKLNGKETNCVNIYDNMAFDIMADLGFGQKPEESMQSGAGDPSYMRYLHGWMRASNVLGSLRNLCEIGAYVPQDAESKGFNKLGEKMLGARQKMGIYRPDIFTHLLSEDGESGMKFTQAQLLINAQMLMVAGSDTTSVTMTCLFRLLSLHPEKQRKLRKEITEAFPDGETPTCATTTALPFLNGVVQEALRMWPAVPTGPQATTPPRGYTIAGTFVPGNVEVRIPPMAMMSGESSFLPSPQATKRYARSDEQLDARYFPRPDEFLPERWTTEMPELVKDKRAFIPFGYGAHSCIGRPLAMNEMRTAVARVIQKFEVQPGESYDDKVFRDRWKDYFLVRLGPCPLKFVPRKM